MRAFQTLSIKRKLMLIILLTSGIVLLLACAAFVAYDLITFRRAMRSDLNTLAAIMAGNNWGALALDDVTRVERSLVTLFQPVMDRNNERVGTLYMGYLDETKARFRLFFSVVAVILVGAVGLAL